MKNAYTHLRLLPLALSILSMCFVLGCSDDELVGFDRPCPTGTIEIDGVCRLPDGAIRGRFCDVAAGLWWVGLSVSVQGDALEYSTTTNGDGWFFFGDIPPGDYTVRARMEETIFDYPLVVRSNEVTRVGDEECNSVFGSIEGGVCDPITGSWVSGARVILNGSVETTTDQSGRYRFSELEPGDYQVVTQWGDSTTTLECRVEARQRTDLGPEQCDRLLGSIRGRICVGDHYWLSQARVEVEIEEGVFVHGITDADGYFQIDGLPQGDFSFEVSRGSYSTSFDASIVAGQQTVLHEPICIPPDTKMAVVTGLYDSIEVVLENLGFAIRRNYTNSQSEPTIVNPEGNIDIINGADPQSWFHGFMNDPLWMDEYDIIFFNCGLDDTQIRVPSASLSGMIGNLQGFLGKGRSVYASDWASEIIRLAFPERINFQGSDLDFGAARVGAANTSAAATIVDAGLMSTVGQSDIIVNFNFNIWSALEAMGEQPSDLHVMVKADVALENGGVISDSPIVTRFNYGAGRVVFTSPHHESQLTSDLAELLNYMVFEL